MTAYLIPGVTGLLTGLLLHWTGFSKADNLRDAWGLRRSLTLRSGLTALGWAMALTALLCWLAVIDVDAIEVLPLSLGALLGGAILGVSAGLCGFTPTSAFAGLGAGNAAESLCVLAGCFAGTLLLPSLDGLFTPLRTTSPYVAATLFEVTLDEPWLIAGGFLGQGCAGLLLAVIAMCIPSPRVVILTDEQLAARAAQTPVPEEAPTPAESPGDASAELSGAESPDPESAADDTFVALLEGEEPLIVDTGLPDEAGLPEEAEPSREESPDEAAE